MRVKLLIFSFLGFALLSNAQTPKTEKDLAAEKAATVATRLKLGDDKKKSVYNVFSQTDKRIADLELGTPDYAKLITYINQERNDMLKVALSPEEYSEYQKLYASKDMSEISRYISQNNTFMTKKAADELKAKKEAERIMNADKAKIEKEELKAKIAAKKAEEKAKQNAKKEAEKQKAADKKEKEKQKAAAKKLKEQEKKELAKQKALEKKQKELEKKLKKK
ncbi:MAG: hypothetical protein LBG92_09385 [Prevotellaceae bacterium]|jgi:hypothetical protein|nr:hypothetical protein [Prevotellaceae bacterium]